MLTSYGMKAQKTNHRGTEGTEENIGKPNVGHVEVYSLGCI